MSKCNTHNNCVGYFETPEQVAANLCEYCLEAQRGDQALRLRTEAIVEAATELLDLLDGLANVEEPSPFQQTLMESLRAALAA